MFYRLNLPYLETDSRGLEQFLFLHGIRFVRSYQSAAHRTVWVYKLDSFTLRVVKEWKEVLARRLEEGKSHVS